LNIAKDLARDLFSHSAMPNDEDGIMAKFKELAEHELYKRMELKTDQKTSIESLLGHYDTARYPGKQVLEKGKKLLNSIITINDVRTFFETLRSSKEDLLDYEEDVPDVRKFFISQRVIFDKALAMLDRYDKNRAFILDEKTIQIINEIERITKQASPYSEIHLLPKLTEDFATQFMAHIEEICVPIEVAVREDWDAVKQEYTAKNLTDMFAEKARKAFDDLLYRLSHAQNIYEAIAMKTESDMLKTRLIGEIANEAAKREAVDNEDKTPPRRVKTVSVKSLFPGTLQASSVEEIDNLVEGVRKKLVAQLDENTTIQIV
jgi:hypothetical protein